MAQKVLILSWIIVLAPAFAVWAYTPNMELVGKEPFGPTYAVHIANDYAYVGAGSVLLILDVSDPSDPIQVGCLIYTSSGIAHTWVMLAYSAW